MKKLKLRTEQEKEEIINRINELKKEGKSAGEAFKAVAIKPSVYYAWMRRRKPKQTPKRSPKERELLHFPLGEPERLTIIAGPTLEVLQALDRLVQLKG